MTNKSEAENFVYETKCRRCGGFTEWFFSSKKHMDWLHFAQAVQDYVDHARLLNCDTCGKETVQDVVSYSSNNQYPNSND